MASVLRALRANWKASVSPESCRYSRHSPARRSGIFIDHAQKRLAVTLQLGLAYAGQMLHFAQALWASFKNGHKCAVVENHIRRNALVLSQLTALGAQGLPKHTIFAGNIQCRLTAGLFRCECFDLLTTQHQRGLTTQERPASIIQPQGAIALGIWLQKTFGQQLPKNGTPLFISDITALAKNSEGLMTIAHNTLAALTTQHFHHIFHAVAAASAIHR